MKIFAAILTFVGLLLTGAPAMAQPNKPTIVLVHGAFADSSSWYGVITILERDGYSVLAAANPLRSVKGDADTVRALLASINTPVVESACLCRSLCARRRRKRRRPQQQVSGQRDRPGTSPAGAATRWRPRPLCSAGKIPRCVRTGRARGCRETSGGGAEARHGHRVQ